MTLVGRIRRVPLNYPDSRMLAHETLELLPQDHTLAAEHAAGEGDDG
jgi:hypothetical protein